ncbi:MAG: histidinol-phosphate transaminase [Cloacibacillus sp.]
MTNQEKEKFFAELARPAIGEIEPYDARTMERPAIRVSANENNAGVPASVLYAMREALCLANRYPDSRNTALREKLAARFALSPDQFITSNGLDGLFTMLGRAFLDPGCEVLCGECTFGVYAETAKIAGASVKKIPLDDNWKQLPERFAQAVTAATRMLFFCNPNNPTGTYSAPDEITRMLRAVPTRVIVVLDEAYIDFADADKEASFRLLSEFPNLLICRTFSKIFSLAGMRVGWAAADPRLLESLYKVREPYCVTAAAEAGACAALEEREAALTAARTAACEREKLCAVLKECGLAYIPSAANFVLTLAGERHDALTVAFAKASIDVRTLFVRGAPAIRISIGTPTENREVARVLLENK